LVDIYPKIISYGRLQALAAARGNEIYLAKPTAPRSPFTLAV